MKNIIELPSEYWYALTWMAQDLGYKSRQDLVAFVIKTTVDRNPEALERGLEKASIMETAKEKVKQMEGRSLVIDPVDIPVIKESENLRWQLILKDGESVVIFAPSLLEAGQKYFKNPEMTIEDFWEKVESGKELKKLYLGHTKIWNG
ncbi:MAG: hypothetical protein IT190_08445 [Microbacteriaceae bacterium]|jgi:hypothetical protein|nr:hypothetical protein [Microbacteriaceae bacterium]